MIEERDSSGLNQYGDDRSGEKGLGSEYILKVDADGSHVDYEREESSIILVRRDVYVS